MRWSWSRICLPFFVILAASPPAYGQEMDAGRLRLLEDGQHAGIERYRVWITGSIVNAVASIESASDEVWQVGLQMDADFLPVKYELRAGASVAINGDRFADRLRFHSVTPEGERWKEYPPGDAGIIFEPGVAHHYLVLVRVLRSAPNGSVEVILPAAGRSVAARIAGRAEESLSMGGGGEPEVRSTRFDLEIDGERHTVWLDADDRLLRTVDHKNGREAVRANEGPTGT